MSNKHKNKSEHKSEQQLNHKNEKSSNLQPLSHSDQKNIKGGQNSKAWSPSSPSSGAKMGVKK